MDKTIFIVIIIAVIFLSFSLPVRILLSPESKHGLRGKKYRKIAKKFGLKYDFIKEDFLGGYSLSVRGDITKCLEKL